MKVYPQIEIHCLMDHIFFPEKKDESPSISLGSNIWKSIVNGYTTSTTPPTDTTGKKLSNDNARAMHAI